MQLWLYNYVLGQMVQNLFSHILLLICHTGMKLILPFSDDEVGGENIDISN